MIELDHFFERSPSFLQSIRLVPQRWAVSGVGGNALCTGPSQRYVGGPQGALLYEPRGAQPHALARVLSRTVDVRNAEATKGLAMMRTCLISACLLVASSAVPSFAEIYRPWCVVYSGRDSGARTCTFTSYEQCMMTAGPGTGGSCIQNPWFLLYGSNDPSNSGQGRRAK